MTLSGLAPAKVNLFLHVGPVKPTGRHDLDSLVVFSDEGTSDRLTVETAASLSLRVIGPFAAAAGPVEENLVMRAARALQAASGTRAGAQMTLDKRLPVAAGIGGGSSDAAAMLRLLTDMWAIDPAHASAIAPTLGGDVPVAMAGEPALMRGEGERVIPVVLPARLPGVLVNPGIACPTGPVFRVYDVAGRGSDFREIDPWLDFLGARDFIDWLSEQRNDLEVPAIEMVPEIAGVLDIIRAQPGLLFARMSGSGATCFGIFEDLERAARAAMDVQSARPGWWTAACWLGGGS